jgi:hypothetical protein
MTALAQSRSSSPLPALVLVVAILAAAYAFIVAPCQDRAPVRLPDLGADPATNEQADLSNHARTSHAEAGEIWQRVQAGDCQVYCFGARAYIICPGIGKNVGFVPLQWRWDLNKWLAVTAHLKHPNSVRNYMEREHGCTVDLGAIVLAGVLEEVVNE